MLEFLVEGVEVWGEVGALRGDFEGEEEDAGVGEGFAGVEDEAGGG